MNSRVIHLSENDIKGGASFYAYRVHKFYSKLPNYSSRMIVLNKYSKDKNVFEFQYEKKSSLYKKTRFFLLNKKNKYSFYNFGKYVIDTQEQLEKLLDFKPDIIIIYNNTNFIHPKLIKFLANKKINIYFFLMDMELITGGCHYNYECEGYKKLCNACPAIKYPWKNIPKNNLDTKFKYYKNIKINFLSPNKKVLEQVNSSKIFNKKLHTNNLLYLGIDLKTYKPKKNRKEKSNKIIIGLRSSYNPRKGIKVFEKILLFLNDQKKQIKNQFKFYIIGESLIIKELKEKKINFSFKNIINSEKELIEFYQKCDFFLNTSTGDLGPVMVNESLACGTPVVSSNNGVARDLIKNYFNGFLTEEKTDNSMLKIVLLLTKLKKTYLKKMRSNSRRTALNKLDIKKFKSTIT